MVLTKRRPQKRTSYSYRYHSLSTKEVRGEKKYKWLILLSVLEDEGDGGVLYTSEQTEALISMYLRKYYWLKPRRTRRRHVSARIEDFSEMDCFVKLRTRKRDLYRLLRAFRLENAVFVAQGYTRFEGEEVLLIGLARFCTEGKVHHAILQNFPTLDGTRISRAISIFVRHMIQHFAFLLTRNLDYWVDSFPIFAEAIRKKLHYASDGLVSYPPNTFRVAMFHDDTILQTCRPGCGPDEQGGRKSNLIQQAFYTGWKKIHGKAYYVD